MTSAAHGPRECPNCEYPLGEPSGGEITCPECGVRIESAELDRFGALDRFDNPVYRQRARPGMVLAAGLVVMGVSWWLVGGVRSGATALAVVGVGVLTAWCSQLARAVVSADWRGLQSIALLHVVYVAGATFVIGGVAWFILAAIRFSHALIEGDVGATMNQLLVGLSAATAAPLSFWALKRLDQRVGSQCKRDLLIRDHHWY